MTIPKAAHQALNKTAPSSLVQKLKASADNSFLANSEDEVKMSLIAHVLQSIYYEDLVDTEFSINDYVEASFAGNDLGRTLNANPEEEIRSQRRQILANFFKALKSYADSEESQLPQPQIETPWWAYIPYRPAKV